MILKKLFLPGNRTYTASTVALLCAMLLQADSQEILVLAPMLKIIVAMILSISAPLVPVFLRKALPKDFHQPPQ